MKVSVLTPTPLLIAETEIKTIQEAVDFIHAAKLLWMDFEKAHKDLDVAQRQMAARVAKVRDWAAYRLSQETVQTAITTNRAARVSLKPSLYFELMTEGKE